MRCFPELWIYVALGLTCSSLRTFALSPVFPKSGVYFPDYDCLESSTSLVDWQAWLSIFEEKPVGQWVDDSTPYLDALADSNPNDFARLHAECPLGVMTASIIMYVVSVLQGDSGVASLWKTIVQRGFSDHPLHVITGSRWPVLALITAEPLKKVKSKGRSISIADDPSLNCAEVQEPALNWRGFFRVFQRDTVAIKDWYENSIRYAYSWQQGQIREILKAECPMGVRTINMIHAFTCATSESSCYEDNIAPVQAWLRQDPDAFEILAHSRWPLAMILNHLSKASRHKYALDFRESELTGAAFQHLPAALGLGGIGQWIGSFGGHGFSRSFRDLVSVLPHLGPGPNGAENLVYITMIYGHRFNRHLARYCSRAKAVGSAGERLILFTLDGEAYDLCQRENGQRCVRGTPSIMNKFTLPLMCAWLGLDSMWLDLDVFLMKDPTTFIVEHAGRGPYDILISGSYESDCICNGIVYFRSTGVVRKWLLGVLVWMYNHPYEHDQKTFSAFLNYTETVSSSPLDLPEIPKWDTLDPINQFVTPDTFEGNGWSGDIDAIVIYHFLNGESDTGSGLDPSGTWSRENGNFGEAGAPPPCAKGETCAISTGRLSLMDLFYTQPDDDLYRTAKPAQEIPVLRQALLASRKETRRTDLLGKPCGPLVGVISQRPPMDHASQEELARVARKRTPS